MDPTITALLRPRSIAILGASADFNKLNGRTLKALLDKHYTGALYPVNPKYVEIAGLPCYPDVAAIPGAVDLAVVAVPAKRVPQKPCVNSAPKASRPPSSSARDSQRSGATGSRSSAN
jgi:predicted CoA-binding protein